MARSYFTIEGYLTDRNHGPIYLVYRSHTSSKELALQFTYLAPLIWSAETEITFEILSGRKGVAVEILNGIDYGARIRSHYGLTTPAEL